MAVVFCFRDVYGWVGGVLTHEEVSLCFCAAALLPQLLEILEITHRDGWPATDLMRISKPIVNLQKNNNKAKKQNNPKVQA
jgi:hypothetical protein